MRTKTYDIIIAGSGSVGTPTALFLTKSGLKVLVIDPLPSSGQGSNKRAIGGVRATHSDSAKIYLCANSIDILSSWENKYGDDIDWQPGGYAFVAYDESIKNILQELLIIQKSFGLEIDWRDASEIVDLVPGINQEGLLGGTFSPHDGFASPLKANYSYFTNALRHGAEFHFHEKVIGFNLYEGKINQVVTDKDVYSCKYFINAAGSWAAEVSDLLGVSIPVKPDSHEAGITEPVAPLLKPMLVDIRERPGSSNFYFYQQKSGKIIFCVTPNPLIWGNYNQGTPQFLPMAGKRLIEILPQLANIRVRRTWRGTYPMTPDGSPLVGTVDGIEGYILATGMCGQGFMLGPGVANLLTHLIHGTLSDKEIECLNHLRYNRAFTVAERLK
ncbi:MAG: NAD(P)/FAD-dependent oxidoreductase [Anaerolineaceae bacterium]|jgi:sarcosine oxidase subunit beta